MATYRIDHVVIKVTYLTAAIRDYAALGFTVAPGGTHEQFGTRNALIGLADGSYLELIAFEEGGAARRAEAAARSAAGQRLMRWGEQAAGLVDWALVPDDLGAALQATAAQGLRFQGPIPGSRRRPDGEEVAWLFGIPDRAELPFFCADVTPRERRVPGGAGPQHPNGARAIHRLLVAVRDLTASAAAYQALLGVAPTPVAVEESEREGLAFPLGSATIVLAERPAAQGEGPYALELLTDVAEGRLGRADPALTHGARLLFVTADVEPRPPRDQ